MIILQHSNIYVKEYETKKIVVTVMISICIETLASDFQKTELLLFHLKQSFFFRFILFYSS